MERPRYRGYLKLLILSLLEEKPMHGYAIMSSLEEHFGIPQPSAGAIYPILASLKKNRLIAIAGKGKREKKVYQITDKGKDFLRAHEEELKEILERMELFKEFGRLGGKELAKTLRMAIETLPEMSEEQKKELSREMKEFTRKIKLIMVGGELNE